jgi:endonuclease YncB( thermonuclease family)
MFEYYVKSVNKVVDGDTIDVVIDLGFDIGFTTRVRLAGIDTPESRTKDLAEKALGLESKKYFALRMPGTLLLRLRRLTAQKSLVVFLVGFILMAKLIL